MKAPAIMTVQTRIVRCRSCPVLRSRLLLLWDEGLRRRLESCLGRCRRRHCECWLRKRRYVLIRADLSVVRSPARVPRGSAVSEAPAATSESSTVVSAARLLRRRAVRRRWSDCRRRHRSWRDVANCRLIRTRTGVCDELHEHGFEVVNIFCHGLVAVVGHVHCRRLS